MRVLQQSMDPDRPDYREAEAAFPRGTIVSVGDRFVLDEAEFLVESAYPVVGRGMTVADDEDVWELALKRSGSDRGGRRARRLSGGPPTLRAGAEAIPPDPSA